MSGFQKFTFALWVFLALGAQAAPAAPGVLVVKGKTVDAEEHPLAGVAVQQYEYRQLTVNRPELEPRRQATSDSNGEFQLEFSGATVQQAPVFLTARKSGMAAAWTQLMTGPATEVRLVMMPSSFLAGQVVDEADKPVGRAQVSVAAAYSETPGGNFGRSFGFLHDRPARDLFTVQAGADGRFRIEAFPTNASAILVAEAPGKALRGGRPEFFNPDSMPWRAGQDDIRLVLEAAGSVEGKIVIAEPGDMPVAQISIVPNGPGALSLSRAPVRSAPDGTFRLLDLRAGAYSIQATFGANPIPDWVADAISVTVESGQTTRGVEFQAVRGGLLEIAVRGSKDTKPVDEVAVNAYWDRFQSGTLSSNGVAILRLPPGDYQVNASKRG
jgi:hypothetical protein